MMRRSASMTRLGICLLMLLGAPARALALGPDDAPPLLPPIDPIEVATAQQLIDASCALQSGVTILLAAGTYDLSTVTPTCGTNSVRVGSTSGPPLTGVAVRGATGNPEDVVIIGAGMDDSSVDSGIQVFGATDVLIADLTIRDMYYHAILLYGAQGASDVHIHHVRALDTGLHLVKSIGADAGVLDFSELAYTGGVPDHPELSFCLTAGIELIASDNWEVHDNLFHDIRCANQEQLSLPPSVVAWQDTSGTWVERNRLVDVARGIVLGISAGEHLGGIVRNNFIRFDPSASNDVGIFIASPDALVLHNTVLLGGSYPFAIEVRWATTTGVEVRNNLLDGTVSLRDGASATQSDNLTNAQPSWFVDEPTGDLHLEPTAIAAIDQVTRLSDAIDDFDESDRPTVVGAADIGADEIPEPTGVSLGVAAVLTVAGCARIRNRS